MCGMSAVEQLLCSGVLVGSSPQREGRSAAMPEPPPVPRSRNALRVGAPGLHAYNAALCHSTTSSGLSDWAASCHHSGLGDTSVPRRVSFTR